MMVVCACVCMCVIVYDGCVCMYVYVCVCVCSQRPETDVHGDNLIGFIMDGPSGTGVRQQLRRRFLLGSTTTTAHPLM